ncbi:hypothetical protein CV093_12130 [Oceanobacillus sp. 143]|nr:hypothetical protein CV093_12130 [Oceanobacillus sp. 143]
MSTNLDGRSYLHMSYQHFATINIDSFWFSIFIYGLFSIPSGRNTRRLLENKVPFSSCDETLPELSLSCGEKAHQLPRKAKCISGVTGQGSRYHLNFFTVYQKATIDENNI